MSAAVATTCVRHPKRQATNQCLGCGSALCGLCTVPAGPGNLCKGCAHARPEAQHKRLSLGTLVKASLAGFVVSILTWLISLGVVFAMAAFNEYLLVMMLPASVLVGVCTGLAMTFVTRGRYNGLMRLSAVFCVIFAFIAVRLIYYSITGEPLVTPKSAASGFSGTGFASFVTRWIIRNAAVK